MQEDRIIIEVEVNAGESAEKLADVRSRMDALKDAQKTLRAEMKSLQSLQLAGGKITEQDAQLLAQLNQQYATNARELKELTAEEKMYTNQIGLATQGDVDLTQSITVLGQQLAALKAQYRSLDKEQRESAAGQDMLKNIQQLDDKVKEFDYSLGDHQRNVGNYASALLGLNGNVLKVAQLFQGGFKNGIAAATKAVGQFAKTLLTTPLGWIMAAVAAVVGVFKQLRAAFERNDDASTALSVALAKLQPIVTAVRTAFEGLATVVASVVGAVTSAASAVIGFLVPSFKEASKAAAQLETDTDRLQDKQREYAVATAQRERDIAELRKEAANTDKYTAKQREQMYQQIDALEKKDLEERRAIAKENLRITEERYKRESDSSDAAKDAIAKARADVLKAETEYLNGTVRIASRAAAARKQEADEEKRQAEERRRRWEEAKKQREDAAKTELEELRKLQDMQTAMINDEVERRRRESELSYARQIEDLKKRLTEEKNLTAAAKKAINDQITLIEQQAQKAQLDITADTIRKENELLAGERIKLQDLVISLNTDDLERQRKEVEVAYQRQIADLQKRLEEENTLTVEARELLNQQIVALQEKQNQDLAKLTQEGLRKTYEETSQKIANEMQERLNEVYGSATEAAEIELEFAMRAHEYLVSMDEDTKNALYKNEEDYKAAVLKAEDDILQARTNTEQALQQQVEQVGSTLKAANAAMSDLFEAVAGDTKEFETFKKAVALADAAITLAQTIAAATAVSTEGDPYTMAARIAANVAAVVAQFAAVVESIKSASIPSVPKFEQGGIVPGRSYTGDKVPVMANSREMVLTLEQQKHLFDLITVGFPAMTIDYDRMAAAFADGAREMPAPTLVYREFKRFERDVAMSESKIQGSYR